MPGGWPARLNGLRQRYVAWYAAAHRAKVLGPAGDDRREEHLPQRGAQAGAGAEPRLHLRLPSTDLEHWQGNIAGLKACREFHEGTAYWTTDRCPSCHYDPRTAASIPDADAALDGLEDELGRLLADWQQAVVSALGTRVSRRPAWRP